MAWKAYHTPCECNTRYTCGYCLNNAKPSHFTTSTGASFPITLPLMGVLHDVEEWKDN